MNLWRRLSAIVLCVLPALGGCLSPQPTPTPTRVVGVAPTRTPIRIPTMAPTQAAPVRIGRADQVSFRDDLDGALGEGWSWLDERPSHWSLSDIPGALRLSTVPGEAWTNALVRDAAPGDFEIETLVRFEPTANYAAAGLFVRAHNGDALVVGRAYCDHDWCAGNAIYFDQFVDDEPVGDNYATPVDSPSLAHLRLRREGDTFTAFYSADGKDWQLIGQHEGPFRFSQIGLVAHNSPVEIPAIFEFFELKVLPEAVARAEPTARPTSTRAPTRTPRATPTRAPTRTPTPPPCQPHASFVADVTIPDGTPFDMGAPFTKVWRMVSDGCAPWPAGTTWAFVSGDRMGAPASVAVPETALGGTVDLAVDMVAPDASGTYQGLWQMQLPDGAPFGAQAYVIINVNVRPPRQLATGTVIREVGARNGSGQLEIGNELDTDGVAVLSRQDGAFLVAVYIRNHDSHNLTGIPDGTYELYFTLGEDWDAEQAQFTRKRRLSRFEDLFPFTTTATTYSIWSVTLHPVAGGTGATESVPEGQFPDLK
ncbi:MAG: hypothetical protein JXA09_06275 [Anaerolineae bacterium]|nr:hypothetical protein [Anaerolineae bacterium]